MRARIDISELESETKIRAKYLRALENEEWDLLPGPTYVKSFLRTYADALGLDGKLLVDEYKLRHDRLSDVEMQPIAPRRQDPRRGGSARGGRGGGGGGGRGLVLAFAIVLIVGALYLLGRSGGGSSGDNVPSGTTSTTKTTTHARRHRARPAPARPKVVTLTLIPTGTVYVCLQAAGGRTLVPARTLAAGQKQGPFRSSKFRMAFGNGSIQMRVGAKTLSVPQSANPVGYVLTARGRTAIKRLPTCGA